MARSHWQINWLLADGLPTAELARLTGYFVPWVRELSRRYREAGPAGAPVKRGATARNPR